MHTCKVNAFPESGVFGANFDGSLLVLRTSLKYSFSSAKIIYGVLRSVIFFDPKLCLRSKCVHVHVPFTPQLES